MLACASYRSSLSRSTCARRSAQKIRSGAIDIIRRSTTDSSAPKRSSAQPKSRRLRREMGMICAGDPQLLTVDEILLRLPVLDSTRHSHIDTAMFVATPGLAPLVDPSCSSFLASAMQKCFNELSTSSTAHKAQSVKSVVGIVDKLAATLITPNLKPRIANGLVQGDVQEASREGLAYFLTSSKDIDLRARIPSSDVATKAQIQLDFDSCIMGSTSLSNCKWRGESRIALPLANTLFVNGHNTTLFECSWRPSSSDQIPWTESAISHLDVVNIHHGRPSQNCAKSWIRLTPLTAWRPIASALGNIVREVEVDGKVIPASTELESAVERVRKSTTGGHFPSTNVYAMLRPAAYSMMGTSMFSSCFWVGYRLHRVTGGGGGWGRRVGLLSLDPLTSYAQPEPVAPKSIEDWTIQLPDLSNFSRENSLFKEGDEIALFYPTPLSELAASESEDELVPSANGTDHEGIQWILLGVVPSEQDVPKHRIVGDSSHKTESGIMHLENRIGILTEQGLALSSDVVPQGGSVQTGRTPVESVRMESLLEVPNTWYLSPFN